MRFKIFIFLLLNILYFTNVSAQVLTIDANDCIIISCLDMPLDAITKVTKGTAATGEVSNNGTSDKSATVYYKFQVAKKDGYISSDNVSAYTMTWRDAVGYISPHTGAYPADLNLNFIEGIHTNVEPNETPMKGAPIVNNGTTKYGCNAYWERSANDKETGIGKWRLPNKRELMLMWIFKIPLEHIDGFTAFAKVNYWSASERDDSSSSNVAHCINFNNGLSPALLKTQKNRIRCIREMP